MSKMINFRVKKFSDKRPRIALALTMRIITTKILLFMVVLILCSVAQKMSVKALP